MQTEAMNQQRLMIRPATSADKTAVLAFCSTTWEHGDYIDEVWDDWLTHPHSTLLVGTQDAQPVALAHVIVQEGEGWCEGVRVAPELRGQGLGRTLLRACVAEAQQRGAHVLRLLTSRSNLAMQTMLPQLGFSHCFDATWFEAAALDTGPSEWSATPLTVSHLPQLLADLADTPLLRATGGLYADGWSFATPTPARLTEHLQRGQVVALQGCDGWAILMDDGESDDPMIALAAGDLPVLLPALRGHPLAVANGALRLFLPAAGIGAELATAAGYTAWDRAFGVYALAL